MPMRYFATCMLLRSPLVCIVSGLGLPPHPRARSPRTTSHQPHPHPPTPTPTHPPTQPPTSHPPTSPPTPPTHPPHAKAKVKIIPLLNNRTLRPRPPDVFCKSMVYGYWILERLLDIPPVKSKAFQNGKGRNFE